MMGNTEVIRRFPGFVLTNALRALDLQIRSYVITAGEPLSVCGSGTELGIHLQEDS